MRFGAEPLMWSCVIGFVGVPVRDFAIGQQGAPNIDISLCTVTPVLSVFVGCQDESGIVKIVISGSGYRRTVAYPTYLNQK